MGTILALNLKPVLFLVCARQPGGEGPNVNRRLALYL